MREEKEKKPKKDNNALDIIKKIKNLLVLA
jgi:hypothetical protein